MYSLFLPSFVHSWLTQLRGLINTHYFSKFDLIFNDVKPIKRYIPKSSKLWWRNHLMMKFYKTEYAKAACAVSLYVVHLQRMLMNFHICMNSCFLVWVGSSCWKETHICIIYDVWYIVMKSNRMRKTHNSIPFNLPEIRRPLRYIRGYLLLKTNKCIQNEEQIGRIWDVHVCEVHICLSMCLSVWTCNEMRNLNHSLCVCQRVFASHRLIPPEPGSWGGLSAGRYAGLCSSSWAWCTARPSPWCPPHEYYISWERRTKERR